MSIAIDITNVCLETDRLILRPWQESDLEDLFAYASVPGVGEMAGWPRHENVETSRKVLAHFMEEKNVFALEEKRTGKVIGSFGLHHSWTHEHALYQNMKIAEIGYVLSKEYWGKRLMTEAVRRVEGAIRAKSRWPSWGRFSRSRMRVLQNTMLPAPIMAIFITVLLLAQVILGIL